MKPRVSRSIVFCYVLAAFICGCQAPVQEKEPTESMKEPVDMVYPFLDAANSRWFFFSSACRPFGMVNLNPDTEVEGAWGSGYRYNVTNIKGISHVHAWQLSGPSVMPVVEEDGVDPLVDFYSDFSHDNEKASPGYHSFVLDKGGISVELTSTKRVGFHHYKFP